MKHKNGSLTLILNPQLDAEEEDEEDLGGLIRSHLPITAQVCTKRTYSHSRP